MKLARKRRLLFDGAKHCTLPIYSDEICAVQPAIMVGTPFCEEFDPGSGRTLAACLMHASRTVVFGRQWRTAEEHVGTCPEVGDNAPKGALIPHTLPLWREESGNAPMEWPAAHQVVGGVMAYQADDG